MEKEIKGEQAFRTPSSFWYRNADSREEKKV